MQRITLQIIGLIANAAISGTSSAVDKFEGDGSTTVFTLTYSYASENSVQVFVNGELLNPVMITRSGNQLTLFTAPGLPTVSGNENVIVWGASVVGQAAANAASASASNASGFADEADNWARKTNGLVESTDYSSKAYGVIGGTGVDNGAGSAKDWATKTTSTVGNTSEYSAKYWATQGDVPIVAGGIANITTVAGQISPTNNIANTAGGNAAITTVSGISSDVTDSSRYKRRRNRSCRIKQHKFKHSGDKYSVGKHGCDGYCSCHTGFK